MQKQKEAKTLNMDFYFLTRFCESCKNAESVAKIESWKYLGDKIGVLRDERRR